MPTVISQLETVTVANAKEAYIALKTAFEGEVKKIETVVQNHIGNHQAQAAGHQAEVSAAQAVLDFINPPAPVADGATATDPNAAKAASFVLTANKDIGNASSAFAKYWDKLGGWRFPVIATLVVTFGYAWHSGWLK